MKSSEYVICLNMYNYLMVGSVNRFCWFLFVSCIDLSVHQSLDVVVCLRWACAELVTLILLKLNLAFVLYCFLIVLILRFKIYLFIFSIVCLQLKELDGCWVFFEEGLLSQDQSLSTSFQILFNIFILLSCVELS